ncbi:MAG: hypothetical protein OXG42_01320 [Chloroflexi bacterium]|nr:hypothetical protein [Chloroflexota bacterium]
MAALIIVGAGCAGPDEMESTTGPPDADAWTVAQRAADARWLPILATQDLGVGVKRIAFTLDGLSANEELPTVRVSLFELDEDRENPVSVQYARFISYDASVGVAAHGHANASVSDRALPVGRGVFVVPVRLSAAGLWGLLLEMSSGAGEEIARLRFSVRERQAAPRVGERAPSVEWWARELAATFRRFWD